MSVDPVTLALVAANFALQASREFESPRPSDPPVSLASYGTPHNYLVGTRLLTCPCIFQKPPIDKKKKRKGKGGKQTEWTRYLSWASHIAGQEISAVLGIWFNNNLVYDATGSGEKIYPLGDGYELESALRIYYGTSDQDPDPDMLPYIEDKYGQAGTCPAYRNQAYLYFDRIPAEQIGNVFPDVKVLVSTKAIGNTVNLDAKVNAASSAAAGLSAGIRIEGFNPNEQVAISLPPGGTFTAWAPWGLPSPANEGTSGSVNRFEVIPDDDPAQIFSVGDEDVVYDDYEAARAAFGTRTITGFSSYTFVIIDSPTGDNSGGLSLRVTAPGMSSLDELLTRLALGGGAEDDEIDFSAANQTIAGFSWTTGTGEQIVRDLTSVYDTILRPHDFLLEARPRGDASAAVIDWTEFAQDVDGEPYSRTDAGPTDLPGKIYLTYADTEAGQSRNTAIPPGQDPASANSARELTYDLSNWAADPDTAMSFAARSFRRERVASGKAQFALPRRLMEIEPGDVWTPIFRGDATSMLCERVVIPPEGALTTEWQNDLAELAELPVLEGAGAGGYVPDAMPDALASIGEVIDAPMYADAHDQTAPFVYLHGGPAGPGVWTGMDWWRSDSGNPDTFDLWDGLGSGEGSVLGTAQAALPDAVAWLPDNGSTLTVEVNHGVLTSASYAQLVDDPTLNLVALESSEGWEWLQFSQAELVGTRTWALTGLRRGLRGTEHAMAAHAIGDRFVLVETLDTHVMGAAEIGDSDAYAVATRGIELDEADAELLAYTGETHRPLAPVHGSWVQSGADWQLGATRRTRLGGGSLDGQDVPLGHASESWALDILDGSTVVRTITGTSLPLTYAEADQTADFGAPLGAAPAAELRQVDPTLNLRGFPLLLPA